MIFKVLIVILLVFIALYLLAIMPGMSKKAISEKSKEIMDYLKSNDSITIEIANSLWAQKNFSIKPPPYISYFPNYIILFLCVYVNL